MRNDFLNIVQTFIILLKRSEHLFFEARLIDVECLKKPIIFEQAYEFVRNNGGAEFKILSHAHVDDAMRKAEFIAGLQTMAFCANLDTPSAVRVFQKALHVKDSCISEECFESQTRGFYNAAGNGLCLPSWVELE